MNKVRDT